MNSIIHDYLMINLIIMYTTKMSFSEMNVFEIFCFQFSEDLRMAVVNTVVECGDVVL